MNPFRITCTTCGARLKVTDRSAIGQILACPKCQSMVQAVPPPDWKDTPKTEAASSGATPVAATKMANGHHPGSTSSRQAGPLPKGEGASAVLRGIQTSSWHVPPNASRATRAAPPALPQVAAQVAPAEPGSRWFLPTLIGTAAAGLAIAALVLYLNRSPKTIATSTVADVQQTAKGDASAPQRQAVVAADPPKTSNATNVAEAAAAAEARPKPLADAKSGTTTTSPPPQPTAVNASNKAVAKQAPPLEPPKKENVAVAPLPANPPLKKDSAAAPTPPPTVNVANHHVAEIRLNAVNEAVAPPAVAPAPDAPVEKEKPVRPSLERMAPRAVDVEGHLADPLVAVSYRDTPLLRMLADVSQSSTIPISLDADALAEMNLTCDVPVSAQLKDTTIAGWLEEALAPHGLGYTIVGNQLLIGRPRSAGRREVRYSVADLTGGTPTGEASFADLVRTMVEPGSWKDAAGVQSNRWVDNVLYVNQTDGPHAQLLVLCEKLRTARGLPLRSRLDPSRFRLDHRFDLAKAALAQPVTASYGRPEPLSRIVDYLRRTTKVHLLIDGVALAEQQLSVDTEALLTADREPLGQALTALAEPLDLTWRVIDDRTIEITTPQAAARHADVEFYSVRRLLEEDSSGAGLITRIQHELPPASDASLPRPAIRIDAPSGCLIVRASQTVQVRIAALLSDWQVAKQ